MSTVIGVGAAKLAGSQIDLKTFKTINLGTGLKTADDFRKSLWDSGNKVSSEANGILGNYAFTFTVAVKKIKIDLAIKSVGELGFKDGATRQRIYGRANELGLDLCPAEVGPQLRLQYKDQPEEEQLIVAMNPIADSGGALELFLVGRYGSVLWLYGYYDDPGLVWCAGHRFVFTRRRK